ncbi:cellulose synthase/poly-beta-1,6-N-acetylglucosamine synthase-like glycosyltransferase/peptidoglycan/xylan/chitin deacetylase (PgdA/CDA1 family) [Spinactinospora alkalitolerans]|uniref:Cellulose synthase/poly-beta-1,6-N-acetylglucosamine synthase-like glycosyltransferase/peptidoglycan/xylan/chitin deacetylase (PgdA/CDA1 family) n=1 Tax=Spinactinospora alkalitolerans TaxID=687207 RepID=A0A852U2Q2_9ACTN|nr:bifunctional polysaccharide deacetylase/glycosyltransferase family 2 protein [Spinactinospora alkalitolerans]NYE50421.1 cellulose synthase/poly-beta-1,6-N-acetylglucosamine synthase-like glycosyltransferase/peptidoglycan/xylan/chitin deacetylase (PgdA/CDA1 family) [Spinactinospora alkalitolerans]
MTRRGGAHRIPSAPGVRLRPHWIVGVVMLDTFIVALLISGVVRAQIGVDSRIDPTHESNLVPPGLTEGGAIIDPTHGAPRTLAVPDRTAVLTFDDGPDPTWTPRVLDVLDEHDVPGTFFVVGSQVARNPELTRRITDSGSEIGIHTFTHADMGLLSDQRRRLELAYTQLAVTGATGVTSSLLRPPYSSSPAAIHNGTWEIMRQAGKRGYITVLSDIDTLDWQRPGADRIVANGTPEPGKGGTILLHDAGGDRAQTVAALDVLIPRLKAEGYTFSTVADVIGSETANPPADIGEQARGNGLLFAVTASVFTVRVLTVALMVVGALVIVRLLAMFLPAGRHARRRRANGGRWGPPVARPASVVVPVYNERACIEDTLASLVGGDHPVEIIVVDDGSTDRTADVAEAFGHPDVRVVRKPNGGKASALNTGVAAASHDIIVMMDGDTVFERDTVRRLVQPFADPEIGAVSGNTKVANRRRLIGLWQHIEYVIGFNIDRRVYDLLRCIPTIPGAVGAYRRTALEQAGGVSDATLAEDTDLTIAVNRAGWRVVYEERARGWTEAPSTLRQLWRQRYRWSYGTMQSLWKHRRAFVERGASGRFGRIGLGNIAVFQVLLPVLAPLIDVFTLYGVLFLDPAKTLLAWCAVLALQLAGGVYAFRLDRERMWPLLVLPLQQFVYRQLMYAIVLKSVVTAITGKRMGWRKLQRIGGLRALAGEEAANTDRRHPAGAQ